MNTENKKTPDSDKYPNRNNPNPRNRNRGPRKPYHKPFIKEGDIHKTEKPLPKKSTNIKITRPPEGNENWQKGLKTTLLWVIILISVFFFAQMLNTDSDPVQKIGYTEYRELLDAGKIKSAILTKNHFYGELKNAEFTTVNGVDTEYTKFWVVLSPVIDSEVLAKWDEMGVDYEFQDETRDWVDYLFQILPWILIIFFWFFIMRRMQSGGGTKGIFSFGKSRAKILDNEKPMITFHDVAGCEEAKEELNEIVQFLKYPEKFQKLGGRIPKGALLVGPPGTGKTLLARAVAGEASVPFYSLSGADFVEMFVGVGASRVRDLFEQSKKNSPCIIFIDELDAVGRQRGAGLGGGHDEREQTLNALLVEMDGFEVSDNIILLAATNRPDVLDSALLRPGRFDRQIIVDIPDVRGREAVLRVHAKNIPMAKNVRLDIIAKGTPGMSGADLANLINESALIAAKRKKNRVEMIDIENAKDKVMMGTERRSMVINEKEKRTTAVHEAGHALVARLTEGTDPVHRVTIIPRGRALGLTAQLPTGDRYNYSREFMQGMLAILMGGRVAEQIVLDQMTTGAGNDIERATILARKMVVEWGMSEKLGPMTYGQKKEEIFIGRDLGMHRDFSEDMAKKIDAEVRSIIDKAYKQATNIITKHKDLLLKVSEVLLEKESIDGRQLDRILGLAPEIQVRDNSSQRPHSGKSRSRKPYIKSDRSDKPTLEAGEKSGKSDESKENPPRTNPSRSRRPRRKPENLDKPVIDTGGKSSMPDDTKENSPPAKPEE
ncbi:MAG: ATP-dependent zinc metalloprotease FtsH [Candidatus Marinimicrobia bacterium]|nr:ATP-dependent zinc metalloprotease FtsH [Candidatus Neomarinimicrobiota bacterium]